VTYERPGNPTSAANGHLGVTGWTKKEVKITGNKALIKYVGKSGTAQFKVVNNPTVIRLLKRQIAATATGPIVPVRQAALNAYLDQFGITAKDLRGFGANEEMKNATRLLRRKGPSLNSLSEGKRKSQLKREWLTALAYVAEKVGHSKAILRKQYLVPGMEERWLNQ
jgi:DNA topoisomerase IB